jgi:hypothetical protein
VDNIVNYKLNLYKNKLYMSCFWDSLIKSVKNEDLDIYFDNKNFKINPHNFVTILKNINKHTTNILWNNTLLSKQMLEENVEAINNYDVNQVQNGYYCSTCDPFLFLLSEYLNIIIIHNYNNNIMTYSPKINSRYTIKISSDNGHCWC